MDASVRNRFNNRHQNSLDNHNYNHDDFKHSRSTSVILSEIVWFIILGFVAALYLTIIYMNNILPTPITVSSAKHGEFVEERARVCLHKITSLGHRPVGSHANEKLAVDLILKELHDIKSNTHPAHNLEIDSRFTTGSFNLPFLSDFTSYYENVNNIVVKFSPKQGPSEESVLVNCHYDTVVDAPGN